MIFIFASCDKEEGKLAVAPAASDAIFSYTADAANSNSVTFTCDSKLSPWYIYWDLGSGSFGDGKTITKFFPEKGSYVVRMKIFTEGGTAESSQTITVNEDFKGQNLLKGGEMKTADASNWTVLSISNGVNWNFGATGATASGGNGGHQGIYQAVTVEAGKKYKFDARVFGSGAADTWFEVYINEKAPVAGQDYSGGASLTGLNTWNGCGSSPFDGKLSAISCGGAGNEIQFNKSGTVYVVIKTGGSNLGTTGITLTDVEFYAIN